MSSQIEMPPLFIDRRDYKPELDKFLFVSYSHRDSAFVYADLFKLYENGLRYWYDHNIESGEEWDAVAAEKIQDPNCMGVIFFVSENTFVSSAVEQEVRLFNKVRSVRSDFILKIVSIRNRSMMEIVRDVFLGLNGKDSKEIEAFFPQERLLCMIQTFKSNAIYVGKRSVDDFEHLERILSELEGEKDLFFTDDSRIGLLLDHGIVSNDGDKYSMTLGMYPQVRASDVKCPISNGVFTIGGSRYLAVDWVPYEFTPIEWYVAALDGDKATLVAKNCLDYMAGGGLDKWLNSTFVEMAFSDSDHEKLVSPVSVLSKESLKRFSSGIGAADCSEYSNDKLSHSSLVLIWLSDDVPNTRKKACCTLTNTVIDKGLPVVSLGGVRPVVEIRIES